MVLLDGVASKVDDVTA